MSKGFVIRLKRKETEEDSFATAYEALKNSCFPDGAQWFGWCETDIRLPRPLDEEAFDPRWDVGRIFSPIAELRAQRRGSRRLVLLLTENEEVVKEAESLEGFEVVRCEFASETTFRVLVGGKPKTKISDNPNVLVQVEFPRALDYGMTAGENQALVAEVRCYYDDMHRLCFVRYCAVRAERIGEREVTPLCDNRDKPKSPIS